jgi:hypothetical protein
MLYSDYSQVQRDKVGERVGFHNGIKNSTQVQSVE